MENENITNSAQEDDNIDEFMNAPLGALLRFSNGDYAIVVPDIWLDITTGEVYGLRMDPISRQTGRIIDNNDGGALAGVKRVAWHSPDVKGRMTVADLIKRLPRMREMFPQELQLDWSMAEYLVGLKEQEEATLAGLDRWRDDQQ
jgi:hypothetical protein